jgi:hypothetical protein
MARGTHRAPTKGHSKWLVMMLVVGMFVALAAPAALADKPTSFDKDGRGVGIVSDTGFNEWGYNYQAHLFSGDYCDAYQGADWCQPYVGTDLIMKWNDAWLSNQDRDGDGNLDRHWGSDTYIGSGAWETNMMKGDYTLEDGTLCHWTYFTKIVAVPADAEMIDGVWYTADGVEIGPDIWGEFATVLEVSNDPCAGDHGVWYRSPNNAGFGDYGPQSYQP